MQDSNLMLLNDALVTGTGAEITGAYLDLWQTNADIGPTFDEYEVADPPGAGGDIRPLVWQLTVRGASEGLSDAVTFSLQFSDDGVNENGNVVSFGALPNTEAAIDAGVTRRVSVFRQGRFVKYAASALTIAVTIDNVSLGPVDAGEYRDF